MLTKILEINYNHLKQLGNDFHRSNKRKIYWITASIIFQMAVQRRIFAIHSSHLNFETLLVEQEVLKEYKTQTDDLNMVYKRF